ncbi:2-amino-4-hydroxy-6-hydroxymethyldihydropteridine diphosphokinase [Natronoflexus pectinivorans]|uniref:2-amino-4-hydroxy-6-hydroxymethyldihydropteridine pyrophosphokinase n=1 Tax=Natronoflexus pectinivorans TaxID=682526 RepID=A0A4R2GJ10_9BACT|nr:2-amino-4-hydroxy-6-hydroxymethyldihydropteridine diphosphokinase [Natronoflexus pectinivorans]TCO08283.1 2-amino-4-hydroxy-6-hydroxymethyldihydropteridine diphosphokinase [Natronoflexus pectinivorans]
MSNHKAILLLGGNKADTRGLITQALKQIKNLAGEVICHSFGYESPAWGFQSNHHFTNLVIEISTAKNPEELLITTQQIEKSLGRIRKSDTGYTDRGIDIDILFFDDVSITSPTLTIPHPRLHLRRFTLIPLCEGWGELIHPVFKKTMNELLSECPDEGICKKTDYSFEP